MTRSVSTTTIEEIAALLREQRTRGQPLTILLGTRASEFYKNAELYQALKQHIQEFEKLSDIRRFTRCHEALSYYNEPNLYDILSRSSKARNYRTEYTLLIKWMKAGFIDTLITTHVGTLLEEALPVDWEEHEDYEIIIPGREQENTSSPKYGHIFKIFGDLVSRNYKITNHTFDLEQDNNLKNLLASKFQEQENVLIIGEDLAWDRGIEMAFPPLGTTLWYVNEEYPPQHSHLASILQQYSCKYLIGSQGEFVRFVQALDKQLENTIDLLFASDGSAMATSGALLPREKVFISYAHADKNYLNRFYIHLNGIFRNEEDRFMLWSDRDIQGGEPWEERIDQALDSAKVAVLLVSADFLASRYITEHELPVLLRAAEEKKVTLLSFVLSPCSIRHHELAKYHVPFGDIKGSFCKLKRYDREELWEKLAQYTFKLLHTA